MYKIGKKLDVQDAASVEIIEQTKDEPRSQYEVVKENMTSLNADTTESIDYLNSINSRIAKYKQRMERLNRL